jgi:GT2 family glycosyltransferase
MRISVVIPTFNNHHLTNRCIDALLAATAPDLLGEIVVVDDASTDPASTAWTAAQTRVTPLLLERNHGFSGACNAGAARCTGDAILFLNNDAFAHVGTLSTMHDVLAGDDGIGIVGARLLYSDGSLQHAGLALLAGAVSRWWHLHKRRAGTLADANVARDFLAVTGAALLIRRTLFTGLGGFDEGYANGWEDVDLCLRAWCAGARVRYEPRAVLDHLESATLGRRHDHAHNERRFVERWETLLVDAPRYPLAEIPPIALAVDASAARADDEWALAHVGRWWRAHLGASVLRTRPASRIDRARIELLAAVARRLPTLEIAWGDACLAAGTGGPRVAFVAPRSPADARAYASAKAITAWWTPTDAGRRALVDAGLAPGDVTVVRLGTDTVAPSERSGAPVVAAYAADNALLDRIRRSVPEARVVVLRCDAEPELADVDIFVSDAHADRWGLGLPAALGRGCAVITTGQLDAAVAAAPGVTVVDDPATLLEAVVASVRRIDDVRASAMETYLDARRRLDAYLATQHVSELARALTGGTPTAGLVEVDPAYARRLHGLRYAWAGRAS